MFKYRQFWEEKKQQPFSLIPTGDILMIESRVLRYSILIHCCVLEIVFFFLKFCIMNPHFIFTLEIASGTQAHCDHIYRTKIKSIEPIPFTVNSILANIHVTFCNHYVELLSAIYRLNDYLTKNPKVIMIRKYKKKMIQLKILFLIIMRIAHF